MYLVGCFRKGGNFWFASFQFFLVKGVKPFCKKLTHGLPLFTGISNGYFGIRS